MLRICVVSVLCSTSEAHGAFHIKGGREMFYAVVMGIGFGLTFSVEPVLGPVLIILCAIGSIERQKRLSMGE